MDYRKVSDKENWNNSWELSKSFKKKTPTNTVGSQLEKQTQNEVFAA